TSGSTASTSGGSTCSSARVMSPARAIRSAGCRSRPDPAPDGPQLGVAAAADAIGHVGDRVLARVILVVAFTHPEGGRPADLGGDRLVQHPRDLGLHRLGLLLLRRVRGEHRRAVGRPAVADLAAGVGGVDVVEEGVDQLRVADLRGVIGDLDGFQVPLVVLVGRVRTDAAGVAHHDPHHARRALDIVLGRPEAAAGGGRQQGCGGDGGKQTCVHGAQVPMLSDIIRSFGRNGGKLPFLPVHRCGSHAAALSETSNLGSVLLRTSSRLTPGASSISVSGVLPRFTSNTPRSVTTRSTTAWPVSGSEQAFTILGAPDFSTCSITTTTRLTPATRSIAPPMPLTTLPGTIQLARSPDAVTCIAPRMER